MKYLPYVFLLIVLSSCHKEDPTDFENIIDAPGNNSTSISGIVWSEIDPPLYSSWQEDINDMININDEYMLLAQSNFSIFCRKYNGNSYTSFPQSNSDFGSPYSYISKFQESNGKIYAIGQLGTTRVLELENSNEFSSLWTSSSSSAFSAAYYNGNPFVASLDAPYLSWFRNVFGWEAFVNEITGFITQITTFNNELYVSGTLSSINGIAVNGIAKWNGTSWEPVGNLTGGSIQKMIQYQNSLVAIGSFTSNSIGNTDCRFIAQWNGTSWEPFNNGLSGGTTAYNAIAKDNELFIVGDFSGASGISAQNVIKWNGSNFKKIGSNITQPINKIVLFQDKLYIANLVNFDDQHLWRLD
jgi:hypothetical protein